MQKVKQQLTMQDEMTEFLLYTAPSGDIKVDVFLHNETLWLTQKQMAELFDVNVPAISKHISNVFEDGELEFEAVVSIMETTANKKKGQPLNLHF